MKRFFIFLSAVCISLQVLAQPAPGSFQQTWAKGPQWLENAVIYQIYPSSYKDSDGNGIGDIPGVLSKIDYIESLGVNVVWFNPMFVSGWIDGGYDVKDYYKVDPRFGTNSDMVKLIDECHRRGIKVFLDLVPGHTSMDHPWFRQSMEADANQQYSDYYIWSDRLPDEKAEKELEKMMKQGDIWQNTTGKWMDASYLKDAGRAKFYMKNFYACQPSLNFGFANPNPANPWEQGMDESGPKAVKQELKDIISFWFSKGVDGFRVDSDPAAAHSLLRRRNRHPQPCGPPQRRGRQPQRQGTRGRTLTDAVGQQRQRRVQFLRSGKTLSSRDDVRKRNIQSDLQGRRGGPAAHISFDRQGEVNSETETRRLRT